jgi:proton-coupled amino acid transporter
LALEEPLVESRSYGDLGYRCFGALGRFLTEFILVVAQCAGAVAYLVFIGQNLDSVFQRNGPPLTSYIFMLVPVEIGLSWIESLSALAPFSIFADVCNVLAMGIVMKEDVRQAIDDGFPFRERTAITSNIGGLPFAAGMAVFCFEGFGMTLALENSMQDKSKFPKLLAQTFSGITLVYILFGLCGYIAFGEETRDIVTLNLPRTWSSLAVQVKTSIFLCPSHFFLLLNMVMCSCSFYNALYFSRFFSSTSVLLHLRFIIGKYLISPSRNMLSHYYF